MEFSGPPQNPSPQQGFPAGTSLQSVVNFIDREHPELTSFQKKNHKVPKLSLSNVFSQEDLANFVSEEIAGRFLKTFVKINTLDEIINTPKGEFRAIDWLLKHPNDYVLKPQREGGGNNYFGSDSLKLLPSIKKEEQK